MKLWHFTQWSTQSFNGIMYGVTNKVVPLINPMALVSINNSQIRVDIKAANSVMGWMWFLTRTIDGITRNLKYAAVFMKLDILSFLSSGRVLSVIVHQKQWPPMTKYNLNLFCLNILIGLSQANIYYSENIPF